MPIIPQDDKSSTPSLPSNIFLAFDSAEVIHPLSNEDISEIVTTGGVK